VDVSQLKVPEDYPFPDVVLGRGKDFKWVSKRPALRRCVDGQLIVIVGRISCRICWWLAQEFKVVAIPPSEVSVSSQLPAASIPADWCISPG
jgi:hypothetical protein